MSDGTLTLWSSRYFFWHLIIDGWRSIVMSEGGKTATKHENGMDSWGNKRDTSAEDQQRRAGRGRSDLPSFEKVGIGRRNAWPMGPSLLIFIYECEKGRREKVICGRL